MLYEVITSDDNADEEGGPDPEVARQKFAELRTQYEVTRSVIKSIV